MPDLGERFAPFQSTQHTRHRTSSRNAESHCQAQPGCKGFADTESCKQRHEEAAPNHEDVSVYQQLPRLIILEASSDTDVDAFNQVCTACLWVAWVPLYQLPHIPEARSISDELSGTASGALLCSPGQRLYYASGFPKRTPCMPTTARAQTASATADSTVVC